MNKTFRAVLFATALFPVAAIAQDATAPAEGQDPLIVDPNGSQPDATMGATPDTTTEGTTTTTTTTTTADDPTAVQDPGAPATDTAQDPTLQDPAMPETGTAQDTTTTTVPQTDMASGGSPFVTVPEQGAWRVADLTGKDVYGIDGEDIGEINDVIIGRDGRVTAIIVGVGGFLGIGQKDVAVSMEAMEFGPGMTEADVAAAGGVVGTAPATDATGAVVLDPADQTGAVSGGVDTTGDGIADTPAAGTGVDAGIEVAGTEVRIGDDALPDRIILKVTRQQLEDAPAFEGVRAGAQGTTTVQ